MSSFNDWWDKNSTIGMVEWQSEFSQCYHAGRASAFGKCEEVVLSHKDDGPYYIVENLAEKIVEAIRAAKGRE